MCFCRRNKLGIFNRGQQVNYGKNSNRRKNLRKVENNSPLLNKTGEKMGCIRRTIPLRRTKRKNPFFVLKLMKKNTGAKDTDFEASIEPVFFKCLLIEDLFLKSLSQSFFSVLCGSVFKLSQEKTV
jgi:hypothetical protein